ncbi:isocitrate lyase/phosphoenolpyruvate mutase family protein [Aquimarina sp. BL5]|uniref:isocitrate lyase/PEP mutase family protein n=1 Tax=Aquimarina sp. BL5 TaxID=1714860 RepID=UPI000E472025|nr:isocitrate lyase/phosphoenolpyruvate mutase family protein [Aquimarina sp. BL5]AXT52854.1 isocitrate lyase/phosphoenolpyruvate mutase family protein [Aquimarina sp. BL5]RKN07522.1 isocitrate lyase/phosphoenolpyruvate mutase family protein [Aquimarina sp. BL5]
MNFKDLHHQKTPLLLGNVWDVPSAKAAEKLGFRAIGTSSAAIASLLGYQDGEEMDFSELLYFVKRIAANTQLPLSVDLESGYSRDPKIITKHIKALVDIGVVGINIEDSIVDNKRILLDAAEFTNTLTAVNNLLSKGSIDVFINVRTDVFLLGDPNPIAATKKRIHLYEQAGADGIFTPGIENESDIREIVTCTQLPINVMCMPDLLDFNTLSKLGVQRISMGNFLFDKMYSQLESITKKIVDQQSFQSIF